MGNAKLWWYPHPGGTVAEIDLGEELTTLDDSTIPVQTGAQTVELRDYTIQTATITRVSFSLEKFGDEAIYRQLKALESHLQRGGACALASDSAKAFAAYLTVMPARGGTFLNAGDTPWDGYNVAAAVAAGDEICLETAQPLARRELAVLTQVIGSGHTISPGCILDYTDEPFVLLRHRGFYPALRLPQADRGRKLLQTQHWVVHSFIAELEVVPVAYGVFAGLEGESVVGPTGSGRTMDEILDGGVDFVASRGL